MIYNNNNSPDEERWGNIKWFHIPNAEGGQVTGPIHTVSTSTPSTPSNSVRFPCSTSIRPFDFLLKKTPTVFIVSSLLPLNFKFQPSSISWPTPLIKSLPKQLSERSTIMAKYMNNHSSNCNQMQRFLDQDSQSTVLATCYSVEPSTSKVHGFHYCTTLGAGKYLVTKHHLCFSI